MNKNISEHNQKLFEEFKKLNLPLGEYAIASSGALAIRGIREAGDIDTIVSEKLWNELKEKYEVLREDGIEKIRPSENVEIVWEGSFDENNRGEKVGPSVDLQISRAEIFDGLSFQNIKDCIWFKKHMGREKDLRDIASIEEYFKNHPDEKL